MGQTGTKLSKTEVQLVDQKKYVREPITPNDDRYGYKVRIYKQINSSARVAIVQKVYDTQMIYETNLDIQKILAKLKHPGLVQLLNIVTKKKEQLCSKFYKMKFLYEYVDNDLQKDLFLRLQCEKDLQYLSYAQQIAFQDLKVNDTYKIYYEESELWYIIATVVSVLAYLQERNLIHGDIRPYNLCLTNNYVLKVMTINSHIQTNWTSYMEKIQKLETISTYISPLQLGALQHNIQQPVHDVPKSDIFCLGVIILELCLLESAQDIYDFSQYSIDLTTRIKRIREMNRYSEVFISTLIQMLNLQESKRINPEQLYDKISELAQAQQIVVSNRISSLERVLLVVNKQKYKNSTSSVNNNQNQSISNVVTNRGINNNADVQQYGYINPEKIFEQQQNQQEQNQQQEINQSQNEIPNQDEGEVVQDMGVTNRNDHKQNPNYKNLNISSEQRQQEENNRNNLLSGRGINNLKQSQSLLNTLIAATGQNNPGVQNQMASSQLQNNQNMQQSHTGTFGAQFQNINNQQFGVNQNNWNNNINNQQNFNNLNNQLMFQLLNTMNQRNNQQAMNIQNIQNMMSDPQFSQLFFQLQQNMQNTNNNLNPKSNSMSYNNLPPLIDLHSFGKQSNMISNGSNQMHSPTFMRNSNVNFSLNRLGSLNINHQNPDIQNNFQNNNVGSTNIFGNNAMTGSYKGNSNSQSLQLQHQLNSFQGGNLNQQGNNNMQQNIFQQLSGNTNVLSRGNTKSLQNVSGTNIFNQNNIQDRGGNINQQIGQQNNNVNSNSQILGSNQQSQTNIFGRNKNV